MGRIKSLLIKRTAKKLLDEENAFTESFERNKKVLGNNTMPSKPMRNKIAGYIARLVKMKKAEKEAPKVIKQSTDEVPQYEQY